MSTGNLWSELELPVFSRFTVVPFSSLYSLMKAFRQFVNICIFLTKALQERKQLIEWDDGET